MALVALSCAALLGFTPPATPALNRRSFVAAAAVPFAAIADSDGNQQAANSGMRFNNGNLGTAADPSLNAGTEDAMAKIARKNAEKLAAEKAAFAASRAPKTEEELLAEQAKSKNLVVGIGAAGTLLSGLFILPNLQRLATKVVSGGQDSGYAKPGKSVKKGKPAPKKKGTTDKLIGALFARESKTGF